MSSYKTSHQEQINKHKLIERLTLVTQQKIS